MFRKEVYKKLFKHQENNKKIPIIEGKTPIWTYIYFIGN